MRFLFATLAVLALLATATARPPQAPLPPQAPAYIPAVGGQSECENGNCPLVKGQVAWTVSDFSYDPSTSASVSSCSGDSCGNSGSFTGWYLGKNLGRSAPRRFR